MGGFIGFWCVFVGTVPYSTLDYRIPTYIGAMFFMGLIIAELGEYSTWIPSTIHLLVRGLEEQGTE